MKVLYDWAISVQEMDKFAKWVVVFEIKNLSEYKAQELYAHTQQNNQAHKPITLFLLKGKQVMEFCHLPNDYSSL